MNTISKELLISTIYSRISALDPENASRIMGVILLQDPIDSNLRFLATASDDVLYHCISRAKDYSTFLTATFHTFDDWLKKEMLIASGSPSLDLRTNAPMFGNEMSNLGLMGHRAAYGSPSLDLRANVPMLGNEMSNLALMGRCAAPGSPRSKAAGGMMMGEEAYRATAFGNEMSNVGTMGFSAASRLIHLSFSMASSFRENDVSNYFSIYGPVQAVKLWDNPKRTYGFVTFVHHETVQIVLAKENPHYVCNTPVLVKPYIDKGKAKMNYLMTQLQLKRVALSPHSSPRPTGMCPSQNAIYNNTQDLSMRPEVEDQTEFDLDIYPLITNYLAGDDLVSPSHNLTPSAAISSPTRHQFLSPNHMQSTSPFNQEAFEGSNATSSHTPRLSGNMQRWCSDAYNRINYILNDANKNYQLADSADNESNASVLPAVLDDTRLASPSSQSIFSPTMHNMNDNATATNSQLSSNNTVVSSQRLSDADLPKSRSPDDPSFSDVAPKEK